MSDANYVLKINGILKLQSVIISVISIDQQQNRRGALTLSGL